MLGNYCNKVRSTYYLVTTLARSSCMSFVFNTCRTFSRDISCAAHTPLNSKQREWEGREEVFLVGCHLPGHFKMPLNPTHWPVKMHSRSYANLQVQSQNYRNRGVMCAAGCVTEESRRFFFFVWSQSFDPSLFFTQKHSQLCCRNHRRWLGIHPPRELGVRI